MDCMNKIDNRLLSKANILVQEEFDTCSEEERSRRIVVIALCLKYGFKYQFVGDCVFIYSIIDEWYFCYMKNSISLLHKNKLHTTKQYHCQKKFKSIIHAIQYIKKHDNFYYKPNPNHKYDAVQKLLNQSNKI